MASIPSSSSLVATQDYYRRLLGSTSSNRSYGTMNYSGGVISPHPGLPKSGPGNWWASFFGKPRHPIMTTVSESMEKWARDHQYKSGSTRVTNGLILRGLAQEPVRKNVSETKTDSSTSA